MPLRTPANLLAASALCLGLGSCVIETAGEAGPDPMFSIGGSVTGATGPLALQNSNGTNVILAGDGSFVFRTRMVSSAIYNVTVPVHPDSQTCLVARGSGTVQDANIDDVTVTCTPNTYLSSKR